MSRTALSTPPVTPPLLISVTNLKLGYSTTPVISNLSFDITAGDFICLVGPNGSGKTTLVKSILGLLSPLSGTIRFEHTAQKFIGYIPQETAVDPNFPATVSEIVLSGSLNTSPLFYSPDIQLRAQKILSRLKISALASAPFSTLSGGQRQKVLLARALMATKHLLILDEPSNNLDQKSKSDLLHILKTLNTAENITIIMITHDLDHDNLIGNKILSLRDKDYFFGSTTDFIKKVHHE